MAVEPITIGILRVNRGNVKPIIADEVIGNPRGGKFHGF
jgi:hypothetical protein